MLDVVLSPMLGAYRAGQAGWPARAAAVAMPGYHSSTYGMPVARK